MQFMSASLRFSDVNIKLRVDFDIFPLISVGNALYTPHRLIY